MKKILCVFLALVTVILSLASCRNGDNSTSDDGNTDNGGEMTYEEKFDLDSSEISTFTNPIQSVLRESETWDSYGTGDPFVMRFDGTYYLYVSSKDNAYPGVKCWSSKDLVNWTYEGFPAKDKIVTSAYAPEVYYYNGKFYMYTSPAGDGHYVLEASSPTGPFVVKTENLGRSIDGSVFIDRDGKWYFYSAGGNGLKSYPMTSPTSMAASFTELANTKMNGWTEGPMIVYHDGYYFMTYTGNHVWSKSYRINYAVAETINRFTVAEENPILVSTNSKIFGIGHNSMVKGPDLDGYYIVYHSINQRAGQRYMSIDRIYFNGDTMQVAGPTSCEQQMPLFPDIYSFFETKEDFEIFSVSGNASPSSKNGGQLVLDGNARVITNEKLSGDKFTLELSVKEISGGKAGAIFGYTDDNNFGMAVFDPASQKLLVNITVDGKSENKEFALVKSFGNDVKFNCTQSLQVEKNGESFVFYMNDIELGSMTSKLGNGAVGCVSVGANAKFGYIGASDEYGGSGAGDMYKGVSSDEGAFYAIYCSNDNILTSEVNGEKWLLAQEGNIYNYRILAEKSGVYDLSIQYDADSDAKVRFYIDGKAVDGLELTLGKSSTILSSKMTLPEGKHTLSLEVVSGSAKIRQYNILLSAPVEAMSITFDSENDGNVFTDGTWTFNGGRIKLEGNTRIGRRVYGNENWSDYTVEVEVTPGENINCGLLVRTTNPGNAVKISSAAPTTEEMTRSTDWSQGYFVGLASSKLVLGKQNYGYEEIAKVNGLYRSGTTYTLKVECVGANIKVYVDGELLIDYTDENDPWIQGMVGIRTHMATATFDNLKVYPID